MKTDRVKIAAGYIIGVLNQDVLNNPELPEVFVKYTDNLTNAEKLQVVNLLSIFIAAQQSGDWIWIEAQNLAKEKGYIK